LNWHSTFCFRHAIHSKNCNFSQQKNKKQDASILLSVLTSLFTLVLIFDGLAELMRLMNSIDFGPRTNRIEKLRSHCKTVILLIMHKPESDQLRSLVVTHEDQCNLLN